MTTPRGIVFRRHLARLRANRSIVIGLALGIVLLAILMLALYAPTKGNSVTDAELAFQAQLRFWQVSNLFGQLTLVMAIVLGSSMINDDIKAGTIFGILARPVSRRDYFLGSWFAAVAFLWMIEGMRCTISVGVALVLEGRVSTVALVAMVAVLAGEALRLAMFAALGALFSTGVAVSVGIALVIVESLAFVPGLPSLVSYPIRAVAVILPLATHQERVIAHSLTGALRDIPPLIEIIGYRVGWTTALVMLGIWAFQRREVAPRI